MLLRKRRTFPEKREHCRIDDNILFTWQEVKYHRLIDEMPENENDSPHSYPIETQINLLSLESTKLLDAISKKNPLLAAYLENLERKIDALTHAVSSTTRTPTALNSSDKVMHQTKGVNLSCGGIAFVSDSGYPIGTLLELKMVLPSTLHRITAYGQIVDCIPGTSANMYSIGVQFVRMSETDRAHLAQHIDKRKEMLKLV